MNKILFLTDRTEYIIPDNVTKTGAGAFAGHLHLKSVKIPDDVTVIDGLAFEGWSKLSKYEVSERNRNFTSVDGILFSKDQTKLIQFPKGQNRTEYRIPDKVLAIEECAFEGCCNLTSVIIPEKIKEIPVRAFANCPKLNFKK